MLYDDFGCAGRSRCSGSCRSLAGHGDVACADAGVERHDERHGFPTRRCRRCRLRSRARAMTARRSRRASCISASAPSTAPIRPSMSTTAWPPARPAGASSARRCAAPDTRDALAPAGRALHAGRCAAATARSCASSARSCRCWSRRKIPAALLDALTDPAHPDRHADGHRKGLSARRGRRSRRGASRHRLRISQIPDRPQTAHGFLAEALARRRAAGTPPFTMLCCDNLPANGATLHRLLVAVRRTARCGDLGRSCRRRGRLPVEHGRPHRAGDDRRRPRAGFPRRSASRMPGR